MNSKLPSIVAGTVLTLVVGAMLQGLIQINQHAHRFELERDALAAANDPAVEDVFALATPGGQPILQNELFRAAGTGTCWQGSRMSMPRMVDCGPFQPFVTQSIAWREKLKAEKRAAEAKAAAADAGVPDAGAK